MGSHTAALKDIMTPYNNNNFNIKEGKKGKNSNNQNSENSDFTNKYNGVPTSNYGGSFATSNTFNNLNFNNNTNGTTNANNNTSGTNTGAMKDILNEYNVSSLPTATTNTTSSTVNNSNVTSTSIS